MYRNLTFRRGLNTDVTFALWMFPCAFSLPVFRFSRSVSSNRYYAGLGRCDLGDSVVAMMLAKVDDVASNYVIAAVPLSYLSGIVT